METSGVDTAFFVYYVGLIIFALNGLIFYGLKHQADRIERDTRLVKFLINAQRTRRRMHPLKRK